jgi:hypothetical protein
VKLAQKEEELEILQSQQEQDFNHIAELEFEIKSLTH